jgi:putative SOS response-associated peptidase YedK
VVGMNSKEKIKKKFPTITIVNRILLQVIYNEIGHLILTRSSTDTINRIHHRQPVLLEKFEISRHLGGEDILNSDANNNINFHRVSKDVNSTSNNNSSLIDTVNVS